MPHAVAPSTTNMPSDSLTLNPHRSIFGSISKKLSRKNSNRSTNSTHSNTSARSTENMGGSLRGRSALPAAGNTRRRTPSPNHTPNTSPPTRRPDRPGMNAFTVPSNEPPPAYTPSTTTTSNSILANQPVELSASLPEPTVTPGDEDPYDFLGTFDTRILIDDSGSMAGRSWREVSQALATIAPIVTQHDADGIDIYFLNHKSTNSGSISDGIAPSGYRWIKRASTVTEIFNRVRPQGGTPTGVRVHNILRPYLVKCEKDLTEGKEVKPLNLIVLTDGVPSDDVESVLLSAAKKLDKIDAPPFQVGVQFFQVGNEEGAREALEELDDELCNMVEGGVRDIVDTVTWTAGVSSSQGGIGLTGDGILKAVLGAVVKRLDRRRASGEARRTARS